MVMLHPGNTRGDVFELHNFRHCQLLVVALSLGGQGHISKMSLLLFSGDVSCPRCSEALLT